MNFKKELSKLKKVGNITETLNFLSSQGLIDNLEEIDGLFYATLSFKISDVSLYTYKYGEYFDFLPISDKNTCYIIGGLVSNNKDEIIKAYIRQYFFIEESYLEEIPEKIVIEHIINRNDGLTLNDLFDVDEGYSVLYVPMLISKYNNFIDEVLYDDLSYYNLVDESKFDNENHYDAYELCYKDVASFDFVKECVDFADAECTLAKKLNTIEKVGSNISQSIEKTAEAIEKGTTKIAQNCGTTVNNNNNIENKLIFLV